MIGKLKRFSQNELGAELVEWAVVTLILILATYAILQAVGPDLSVTANSILDGIRTLVGS